MFNEISIDPDGYSVTENEVTKKYPQIDLGSVRIDGNDVVNRRNIGEMSVSYATRAGIVETAEQATKDGNGNVITSKYATLDTQQNFKEVKSFGKGVVFGNNTSNTTQYRSASKASNYVNQVNSQSSVNQLLNTIIYVLSDIAGNTSNASDKLDLLKNLNGSTTNIITNNGSGVPANTSGLQNIINNANGGPSRNSRLASKIAQGF